MLCGMNLMVTRSHETNSWHAAQHMMLEDHHCRYQRPKRLYCAIEAEGSCQPWGITVGCYSSQGCCVNLKGQVNRGIEASNDVHYHNGGCKRKKRAQLSSRDVTSNTHGVLVKSADAIWGPWLWPLSNAIYACSYPCLPQRPQSSFPSAMRSHQEVTALNDLKSVTTYGHLMRRFGLCSIDFLAVRLTISLPFSAVRLKYLPKMQPDPTRLQ